jgi:hypothetical protein
MHKRLPRLPSRAFCVVIALLLSGTVGAAGGAGLMGQIGEAIAKVRTGKTLDARANAAEHLSDLTSGIDPKSVDDGTVADLVSLLDSPDDAVRAWVAGALGNLGPRARTAAPALLKLLPGADCMWGELTSAGFIRAALERIGVKPPPRPVCWAPKK